MNKFFYPGAITFLLGFLISSCTPEYKKSYNEGILLKQKGTHESLKKSLRQFEDAVKYAILAVNQQGEIKKSLGIKMLEYKMFLEGARYLEDSLKINSTDLNALYYLGLAYANYAETCPRAEEAAKYLDEAENVYQKGLEIAGKNALAAGSPEEKNISSSRFFYALGLLHGFLRSNPAEGISFLEKVLAFEPKHIDAHFALAKMHFSLHHYEKTEDHYRTLLSILDEKSDRWINVKKNLEDLQNLR